MIFQKFSIKFPDFRVPGLREVREELRAAVEVRAADLAHEPGVLQVVALGLLLRPGLLHSLQGPGVLAVHQNV